MSDPPAPTLALLKGMSPTFDTLWEDYQRLRNSPTSMVTDNTETTRSALFTGTSVQVDVDVGVDVDVDMDSGLPSPLSDTELSKIVNLEGIEWAIEFTDVARPTSPIYISNANDGSPSVFLDQLERSSQSGSPTRRLLPSIYYRLRDAGSPFWAAVTVDIQHCTWAELSQKLCGREPTKTLFFKVYSDAIARQLTFSPTWRAVKVTLDVPSIVNTEASRDTMIEHALQTKGLFHVIETEVLTTPSNTKFLLALMLTFTAEWVRYRSQCYGKAAFIVLPPIVRVDSGLLPEPQNFTSAFRLKLRNLLDDHSRGWGLLHEQPSDVLALPNSSAPVPGPQFVWFGNSVLRGVVHRALYDPTYPGWFGFLEDVRMSDGDRFWAPLQGASPRQAGQVLGWIEELLNFHISQGNRAREPLTTYAQPADNFTAYDSVIKKVNRHTRFLSIISGGTGEVLEQDDPYASIVGDESEEHDACVQGYKEFIKRPAYLPYHVSVAQYRG